MGSSILVLVLTLAACGGTTINPDVGNDGHNIDGTDGNTGTDETIAASIETSFDGNTIDGISFDISGPDSFTAETTFEGDLPVGDYTISNVTGTFNGASLTSCGSVNLDESSAVLNIPLSLNLDGQTWTCNYDGYDNSTTESIEQSNCEFHLPGYGYVKIDGYQLMATDGSDDNGRVNDDLSEINYDISDGSGGWLGSMTCTRD